MPWLGGLLAGGGSLLSGLFGSNAASSAAKTQAQASQNAINAQLGVDQVIQGQLSPYLNTGTNALSQFYNLLNSGGTGVGGLAGPGAAFQDVANAGFSLTSPVSPPQLRTEQLNIPDPSNPNTIKQFQQSPGYTYNLGQQQNAIQNSAAGHTGALSGNMLQALQTNASGLANQDYYNWLGQATNFGMQNWQAGTQNDLNSYNANSQNYWSALSSNNKNFWDLFNAYNQGDQNVLSDLFNVAGMGQNAATNSGQTGVQLAGNVGSQLIGQGSALAAGKVGGATALSSGVGGATGGIVNALQSLLNNGGSNSGGQNSGYNSLAYLFGQGGGNPSGGYFGSPGGYNYYGPGVDPSLNY